MTSLAPAKVFPQKLLMRWIRGHWQIEKRMFVERRFKSAAYVLWFCRRAPVGCLVSMYDRGLYKGRNVGERHFRCIKEFRRVCTRYDKLNITYNAFIAIANIAGFMRN